ncbi:hypothetical protein SAMN05216288_3806 [Pseudomonas punonensis]|uniref:Uncharacterized protein n=1 Tax=Phytopseudomonas punonensis TaxID=1220495 RepID=A0A1M7JDH3_9GAMM|nr:hypothetical protein SAMN05216288_3806 [Pseudomonas punonensis]
MPMMSSCDIQGIDAAWLAVDAIGQVGLFTTGGEGPIPDPAMPSTDTAESDVYSLPETCDCILLVKIKRPDDFVAFARRGFFAYDWSDIHRPQKQALGGYELQALPTRPLCYADLPPALRVLAANTKFLDATFGSSVVVLSMPAVT